MELISVRIRYKPDRANLELYYVDPLTGNERTKSARTRDRREAERAAAVWENQLRQGADLSGTSWDVFRKRFEREHLGSKAKSTKQTTCGSLNNFERLIGHPRRVQDVTTSLLSEFAAALRKEGKPETTIHGNLGHVRVAIRWAARIGMVRQVPYFPMPKLGKRTLMRGRALTTEEYERLLRFVRKIRPDDAKQWKDLITGLWLSGLRIDEARRLTWEPSSFCVDLTGSRPRFRIYAEGQKRRADELLPMTPDFATWLLKRPPGGFVFPLPNTTSGERFSAKRIIKIISAIGKRARIVANVETRKHATAHDLRRSFGLRWAARVRPLTLQKMMRHSSMDTTLRYYVDQQVTDVESEIWGPERTGDCTEPARREEKPREKTRRKRAK